MADNPATSYRITLARLLFPKESGAWGTLLETILLGLIASCGWQALQAAIGLIWLFFLRQPVRFLLNRPADAPRPWIETQRGLLVAIVFAGPTLISFLLVGQHTGWATLWPLAGLAILGGYQLLADLRHQGRQLLPELAGAIAMSGMVMTIARAGGCSWRTAAVLCGMLILRQVLTILYIRFRIRYQRGKPVSSRPVAIMHGLGLGTVAGAVFAGLTHWLSLLAILLMVGRTLYGFRILDRKLKAATIGYTEMALGLVYVLLVGIGTRLL